MFPAYLLESNWILYVYKFGSFSMTQRQWRIRRGEGGNSKHSCLTPVLKDISLAFRSSPVWHLNDENEFTWDLIRLNVFFLKQDAVNTVKTFDFKICKIVAKCTFPFVALFFWLFVYIFLASRSRIFHSYDGEGLWNKGRCLALTTIKQGRNFIVPYLLWHGTPIYRVSD